jgi:FMN-dependent NADH-azoreductase
MYNAFISNWVSIYIDEVAVCGKTKREHSKLLKNAKKVIWK